MSLIELLKHREELFLLACGFGPNSLHSIGTYVAIMRTCKCFYEFIVYNPRYVHARKMRPVLAQINGIKILSNNYISLKEHYNRFIIYSSWTYNRMQINFRCKFSEKNNDIYVYNYHQNTLYRIVNDTEVIVTNMPRVNYSCDILGALPNWLHKYIHIGYITLTASYSERSFIVE
jgi:hypothetical protein